MQKTKRTTPSKDSASSTKPISSQTAHPAGAGRILQLQRTYGNRAVGQLLRAKGQATGGVAQMVRKDYSSTGAPRSGAAFNMKNDPTYGPWHFHFIKDSRSNTVENFFVTLENYKGQKRHVLFDGITQTAANRLKGDLSKEEASEIMEWATDLLQTQLVDATDVSEEEYLQQVQAYNEERQRKEEEALKIQEERRAKEREEVRQSGSELANYLLDQQITYKEAYIRSAFKFNKEQQWMSDLKPEQIEALRKLL